LVSLRDDDRGLCDPAPRARVAPRPDDSGRAAADAVPPRRHEGNPRRVGGAAWSQLEERKKAGEFAGKPDALCRENRRVTLAAFVADPRDVAKLDLDSCRLANEQPEQQDRWWGALFGSMGDWDYRKDARALPVPRLVIQGEKDFIPVGGSREWVAGNPNARLLLIAGAGHFPHVEKHDIYFPAVERFLSGGWPERAVTIE
jgi:pimeloyl-ACP methyl ester carboxylesterase